MAISNAVQRGTHIYIYNEHGHQVACVPATNGNPGDGLKGYTQSVVNVQLGTMIYSFDEHGHQVNVVPAS